jgi:hypothetical protein
LTADPEAARPIDLHRIVYSGVESVIGGGHCAQAWGRIGSEAVISRRKHTGQPITWFFMTGARPSGQRSQSSAALRLGDIPAIRT